MAKTYEVLERAFINGRLYEPGEEVALEIDSPGSHLKLVKAKPARQAVSAQSGGQPVEQDNLPDA